ncbi:MAG: hypothetical protein EOO30_00185 [Comamonadaceae bacterium]|nr:MAG: hypothetical protein EOO30_00185 [Comamonadaceae bacterium]
MPSARALKRLDALVWALIFGGLFLLILGIASHDEAAIAGWSLTALGGIATTAGVVLIYVRSRLQASPPAPTTNDKETRP